MDEVNFYWTILVALVSAGWIVITFIRDRIAQSLASSSALTSRLMEYDRLCIENPEVQKYISQHSNQAENYFRSKQVLDEDVFYKAKTLVYSQLNLFDEILSTSSKSSNSWAFLRPAELVEKTDWDEYIREKLRHPLYRSILLHEKHIYGASLREFWTSNQALIESKQADPFIW
ncbi:MAG: hypothetical protein IV108_09865 [Burkholderiales bacterium]|nr:hypothetical protein [Burkholderiales bacterium]